MKPPRTQLDTEQIHDDWLGMAQPEGLVVTAAALNEAQAAITWPQMNTSPIIIPTRPLVMVRAASL